MPSHKRHLEIDQLFLKRKYRHVHKYLDLPYLLFGSRHRFLRHDFDTCLKVLLMFGRDAFLSSLLHIILDERERGWKGRRRRGRRSTKS